MPPSNSVETESRAELLRAWATGSRTLSDDERAVVESIVGQPGFVLDPSAPLPAKLRNFYRHTYAQYATGEAGAPNYANSKDGRTIKRWVSAGRHCQPPDLPPLDQPPRMAAWFRRAFPKEQVPAALLAYEDPEPAPAPAPLTDRTPSVADDKRITAIALDGLIMGEGEQVRQARSIAKANFERVNEASTNGRSDEYRRWFPVWSDSLELLRKLEKEDREARKAAGDLIARGPVLAELAQLLEAFRVMHDTMPEKILVELEKSESPRLRRVLRLLRPALRAAVGKVRETELALFSNLETLQPSALPAAA